jgi:hypothetical protein
MLTNKTLASIKPNSKSKGVISQTIRSVSNTEENNSNETQSNNNSENITSENPSAEKVSIQSESQSEKTISRIVYGLSKNRFSLFGAGTGGAAGGATGGAVGGGAGGGIGSGGFSSGGYSSGGVSDAGYERDGSGGTSLFARSGSGNSDLKAASSQLHNNIRQKIDWDGSIINKEPDSGKEFSQPEDNYQARILPKERPTGTGEETLDYISSLSEADKLLYDELSKNVRVYDKAIGFSPDNLKELVKQSTPLNSNIREQALMRNEALVAMVDSLKKDPNAQQYIKNLKERGGLDLFLSDELAYGYNKDVGGYVVSSEQGSISMVVPKNITDWTHRDIFAHEMLHVLDRLADNRLDGLLIGEDSKVQDLMVEALEKFQKTEFDKNKIQKLDVGNLRYAVGYLQYKNDADKKFFTLTEARAVLEQEYADKPEEFRDVGKQFAELADYFEKRTATYKDSYVKKDGKEDGTAMQ